MEASLVWFRRDLRDFDHAALHHALRQCQRVYCVFVFDTEILDPLRDTNLTADRRLAYIHAAVQELDAALRCLGGALIVRHGQAVDILPKLAKSLGVDAVFANHDYEPDAVARDAQVAQQLQQNDQHWFSFKDQVIFEKNEVLTQADKPFTVFTPYKRAWLKKLYADENAAPSFSGSFSTLQPWLIEPYRQHFAMPPKEVLTSPPSLDQMGFSAIDSAALPFAPGMSGGEKMATSFWKRLARYDRTRDFPAQDATSHLSVHLRFGTVSVRALARHAVDAIRLGEGNGAEVWLAELIWRDFYFQILHHFPQVVDHAFKPAFDNISWEDDGDALIHFDAWCAGQTGYPLVDAAMTQLNTTGFMHNRLRMVTASFLIKDLGIDWRWGEDYFARHLNDFDLAANNGGWQWAASSGCDAQPYFRIFNPVTQSQKFDPDGVFIKRHLPQLRKLDSKHIHAPWLAPENILEKAGVVLGENYPHPIIDHDAARKRTLARYAVVKSASKR